MKCVFLILALIISVATANPAGNSDPGSNLSGLDALLAMGKNGIYEDLPNKTKSKMEELKLLLKEGDLNKVKNAIEGGIDVNSKCSIGRTALEWAARWGHLDIVKYLIEEKGADVNAKDNDDATALHLAAWKGYLDIVKYLVEKGADINATTSESGKSAIDIAIYEAHDEMSKWLKEAGGRPFYELYEYTKMFPDD